MNLRLFPEANKFFPYHIKHDDPLDVFSMPTLWHLVLL